ncbi:transcriptional regulator FimZ [Buttiauxella agrestis]|uniref:Transcriptional regulator FimZ n=1 Tax=Buttiauxella agrestis TaxID=82977 RepID=A0A381CAT6_9ENTR|nr:LuxR C-terminal-related transcriptional regulator [Buttiauxella agrestis]SUW64947.1 transcriptional regulator FimZ [Buttiauxella agrestis]
MTVLSNKVIYILSDNRFLLPGVEKVLSNFHAPNAVLTVRHIPNSQLLGLLTQLNDQKNDPHTFNYFIAERHVFYILKSHNLSPRGVLIPPTVSLNELQSILLKPNRISNELNSDFYYRNTHSHREVEIVSLLLEGMPHKSIADKLGISIKTVSHHKQVAIRKSGFSNFNEYYMRNLSIHPLIQSH